MISLKLKKNNYDQAIFFDQIINAIHGGHLIIYPTDTLYALGATIYNDDALKDIYILKKRPFHIPLPIAVPTIKYLEEIAMVTQLAKQLITAFLPGPLTLVLKKHEHVSDILTGGKITIAIRIPQNKIAKKLLSKLGPLTVTSANIHGCKIPESIEEIYQQLDRDDIAVSIDVGKLSSPPSTIVDATGQQPKILREGKIHKEEILKVVS